MISIFKKSLLALGFVLANFSLMSARTVSVCKMQLKEIAQSFVDQNIYVAGIYSLIPKISNLPEEDLIDLCDKMLIYRKELGSKSSEVENIKDELISYLRSFVANGIDFIEIDPNFALFYDEQNPDVIVSFKNPTGEVKTRKYALKIWSIGLKFEFAIKIVAITIVGSGFNYYDTDKVLKLGNGIDLALAYGPGIDLTYSKIESVGNCGVLIAGIPLGLSGGISYVFGGEMTPIKE